MVCIYNNRCRQTGCTTSIPTLGCESTGIGCFGCAIGDFAGRGFEGAHLTHGRFIKWTNGVLGWLIEEPGETKLEIGDLVLSIDGFPANEAWFALHYCESSLPTKQTEYVIDYWRASSNQVETLIIACA